MLGGPRSAFRVGLAVLSGVAYGFGFHPSPIGNWPIGLVALVPLLIALQGVDARRAAWLGWLSGLSATAVGFSWAPGALAAFASLTALVAHAALLPFWIWHGGRFALFAFCAARATGNGWRPWVGISTALVTSELLFPTVVPWYLAGVVHDGVILLQVADLGGPLLVGVVVLSINLLVADALIRLSRLGSAALSRGEVLAMGALVGATVGYGAFCLGRFRQGDSAAGESRITLGIVQGNAEPHWKERAPAAALRRQLLLSRRLISDHRVDAVVWSETSTGFSVDERLLARWVKEVIAPQISVPMVIGTGVIGGADRSIFNSAISTSASGDVVARYDKQRLFPVGEYRPFGVGAAGLVPASANFTEGGEARDFTLLGHRLGVTICYEALWPGMAREAVRSRGAELLVNLTNDIRFGDTAEPWAHFALSRLRAVEQRRYLVRVANSGISAVIDPAGRVVAMTELFEERTVVADVAWMSGDTVYGRMGDAPWYLVVMLCVGICLVRRPGTR